MTMKTQKSVAVKPVLVQSEMELVAAITKVNGGDANNIIDVVKSITLTGNLPEIVKTMTLQSSNNSAIDCGMFNGFSLSSGALVSLSMKVDGPVQNNGFGDGTTLIGLTGGAIGVLTNSGRFQVPAQNTFETGAIVGSAEINGVLNNQGVLSLNGPYQVLWNGTGPEGTVGEVALEGEGLMTIAPASTFHAKRVTIGELSSISITQPNTAGAGCTLVVSDGLILTGVENSLQTPGTASGVSVVGSVTLENRGLFTHGGHPNGCSASEMTNISGTLDMGSNGTWAIAKYRQVNGTLSMGVEFSSGIPNFPTLQLSSSLFEGGKIEVNARTYFTPSNLAPSRLLLIDSEIQLQANLSELVKMNNFPEGMTVSIEQTANQLYLLMSKSS